MYFYQKLILIPGWGKPPVDEYGRPLYGDVFGVAAENQEEKEGLFWLIIFLYMS